MLKAISVLGWLLKIITLQESSSVEANWNLKAFTPNLDNRCSDTLIPVA